MVWVSEYGRLFQISGNGGLVLLSYGGGGGGWEMADENVNAELVQQFAPASNSPRFKAGMSHASPTKKVHLDRSIDSGTCAQLINQAHSGH